MKFKYIVIYEISSDEFDIGDYRIMVKVKITAGVQTAFPFTAIQTVRSYNSTLMRARKLILSIYVHPILIHKMYEYRHVISLRPMFIIFFLNLV